MPHAPSIDEQAFIAAVITDPGSDGPRLVFADWLEENWQEERATFIRVQIELALCAERAGHRNKYLAESCYCEWCEKAKALRRRERALLDANRRKWMQEVAPPDWDYIEPYESMLQGGWTSRCDGSIAHATAEFRRGFIDSVKLPFPLWLTHHEKIRAACPLTTCNLTTRPEAQYRLVGAGVVQSQARIAGFEWRNIPHQIESVDKVLLELLAAEFKGIAFHLSPAESYAEFRDGVLRSVGASLGIPPRLLGARQTPRHTLRRNRRNDNK